MKPRLISTLFALILTAGVFATASSCGGGGGEAIALLGLALGGGDGGTTATAPGSDPDAEDETVPEVDPEPVINCPLPCNVTISSAANNENKVNSAGGGYIICHSQTDDFVLAAGTCQNEPYVSGPQAPTSTTLSFNSAGTYYVKLAGYSALNPQGNESGQIQVIVD